MKQDLKKVNDILVAVQNTNTQRKTSLKKEKKIKAGVDLGTASIVFIVLDEDDTPVICFSEETSVVKDGLVVDFSKAVQIVKKLKEKAEKAIGRPILCAAGAIPPKTTGNNRNVVGHVIEAAEMELSGIYDEPEAAAKVLNLINGAVVDIGGGTTGISIFENHHPVYSADEPTGGHHMSLVLAGNYHVDLVESEKIKRDKENYDLNFQILRPVVEKMAVLTLTFIQDYGKPVDELYLVGGATLFPQFEEVFEKITKIKIIKPIYPQLVTPIGIAMLSQEF